VFVSIAVDRESEPWSGQTYKIGIYWFSSRQAALTKTCWLRIRIMSASGATCLPVNLVQWTTTI